MTPETPKARNANSKINQLMRAMNHGKMPKDGWNPIPQWQHEWPLTVEEIQADVVKLWAWLTRHTIAWDARCEYAAAVDRAGTPRELHLEHAAEELKWDAERVQRAWRAGRTIGLWRNGTKVEGWRKLYPCGEAEPQEVKEEGEEKEIEEWGKSLRAHFSPAILKIIKDWPTKKPLEFETLVSEEEAAQERWTLFRCDLDATWRALMAEEKRTRLSRFGLPWDAQEHRPKDGERAEQWEARQTRVEALHRPALAALYAQFAQTAAELAQTTQNGMREAPEEVCAAPVSLLPQTTPREGSERVESAAVPTPVVHNPNPIGREVRVNQLPTLAPLDGPGEKALNHLFQRLAEIQRDFPRLTVAQLDVSPENKGNQTTARKILDLVGNEEMPAFCNVLRTHFSSHSLGKTAGWGMIEGWAGDFRRARPAREKLARDLAEQEIKNAAFREVIYARRRRSEAADQWAQEQMAALTDERRAELVKQVRPTVNAFKPQLGWTKSGEAEAIENAIRILFRREAEARQAKEEGDDHA